VLEQRDEPPALAGDRHGEHRAHEPQAAHAPPAADHLEAVVRRPIEALDVERDVGREQQIRGAGRAHDAGHGAMSA
jgi:hypothetical protein